MKEIQLNTQIFGHMNFYNEEGLEKDYTISLNNKDIVLTICIYEDFITDENVNVVIDYLDHIPFMYQKAKKKLADDYYLNERIKFFIQCQIEEIREDVLLKIFEIDDINQVNPRIFIDKLEPIAINISQNDYVNIECSFDFSLNKDDTDELLVICFNKNFEVYYITHES